MNTNKPVECVGCNTFDVGSILNNDELEARVEKIFASQQEAEQAIEKLTQKARDVESEPAKIQSNIEAVEGGFKLTFVAEFSCQAELVIFQLNTRSI